ncbi:NAD-dependent epimerase/dehydratase family protein [Reichenbachiella sp.]|uniref:NAD-dependent epimerase/dehydratase family protein n=1 Tax=Reichenbachiella sp. TaxID=2184521 RepID=UPI003BB07E27
MPPTTNMFSAFKKKNVLITGISGFIGSSIAKRLLDHGVQVSGTIRASSQLDKLKEVENEIDFHVLDLENEKEVENLFQKVAPDYIIHAAQPSAYDLDRSSALQHQLNTTSKIAINLLESVRKHSPKRMVHCCGSAIYGRKNTSPFSENQELKADSARGLVKLQERNLMRYYAHKYDVPVTLARIFRAYGPWDSHKKLIIKSIKAIKNDASIPLSSAPFMRDFIFIDDLVEGIMRMCLSDLPNGTELNLGSGHQYSAKEIVEEIEKLMGKKMNTSEASFPANFLDKLAYQADLNHIAKVLNWKPRTSVTDGLRKTIDWYSQIQDNA